MSDAGALSLEAQTPVWEGASPDATPLLQQGGADEWRVGGDWTVLALRGRYAELLSDALKIDVTPSNYLADIDSGFYVSSYLRSWAFEAQLRAYLKERFGTRLFASREAGSLLRELWGEGQRMRAEELLKEVTGSALEMEAVAERVKEVLP